MQSAGLGHSPAQSPFQVFAGLPLIALAHFQGRVNLLVNARLLTHTGAGVDISPLQAAFDYKASISISMLAHYQNMSLFQDSHANIDFGRRPAAKYYFTTHHLLMGLGSYRVDYHYDFA